jgi:hypothetical protein
LLNTGLAGHDADHARGGEQAGADLSRAGKGHEHQRGTGHQQHAAGGARQHAGLGEHAARLQVVFHVVGVLGQHPVGDAVDGAHGQPGRSRDQQQAVEVAHAVDEAQVFRRGLPHHLQRDQRQRKARRVLDLDQHGVQHGGVACQAPQHHAADAVDEQRKRDGDQRGQGGSEPRVGEQHLLVHQAILGVSRRGG